jgi:hypothetical protein
MAQMIPTPADQGVPPTPVAEQDAVRRVTVYLQSIGLPQANATEVSEEIVRSCRAKWIAADEEWAARSVERAMNRVAEWFDRIALARGSPSSSARAQLGWYLRPLIRAHPEVFLHSEDLPEDFDRAAGAACRAVLPLMAPRLMPPQSLWQLPHLWQRGVAYAYLMWYRLKSMRWLERT